MASTSKKTNENINGHSCFYCIWSDSFLFQKIEYLGQTEKGEL